MFNFTKPEDGSHKRYINDRSLVKVFLRKRGLIKHYLWWLFHNCIAHPLIGLIPIKVMFRLHDWSSHRMHPKV